MANSEEFQEEMQLSSKDRFKAFIEQNDYPPVATSHNHSRERTRADLSGSKDNANSLKGSLRSSVITQPPGQTSSASTSNRKKNKKNKNKTGMASPTTLAME